MQKSLARRQRQRRTGAARRPGGGGAGRSALLAIPILLFAGMVFTGLVGFVGTVSAYSYYSRDLPDPKALLDNLAFDQQTTVYDRTGTVILAQLGERKREVVTFADIPPELIDATTSIEDKTFWENAGFDPAAIISAGLDTLTGASRGASTITQQLVRNRLLPPAAFTGSVYDRKAREIIQSIRLTQEFPGQEGKQEIITAYLNQNFYGNQSYGVKAAALGYFGKDLKDLTLAQMAILAAIPQSPTAYDLVRNAITSCIVALAADGSCPGPTELVVPATSEIAQRRDKVLDLMKTRSVLSGNAHTIAEYDAAKAEPIILAPQAVKPWNAAHFVWQVRNELATILCGDETTTCEKVDVGGYKVITTLDWGMQQVAEKWTYAAARGPQEADPTQFLTDLGIPKSAFGWITNLKNRNIQNAATAIEDYRTGQILAYVGSANYNATGTEQFQPQFDVLADGWRQSGSSIKPIDYSIGIDDHTLTAATMFMDVSTDFGKGYYPTQADFLERGPVRLRSALQFSLNVPAIKAGFINGLDHQLTRTKDFGLQYQPSAIPVISESIGTVETHPIDLLGAYGTIANNGTLMPRETILSVTDPDGKVIWPLPDTQPTGTQVISPQAAYIVQDILNGNTQKDINPYWGEWQITDANGKRRPAGYKTGTTSDNRDVLAYGFLAPPEDPKAPALAVGVWMGNSNNEPNKGSLSLDSSAPLWSAILNEVSKALPVADFKPPDGLETVTVDAFSGLLPGPFTTTTVKELFIKGTAPTRTDDLHAQVDVDTASGKLWQDGCAGPMETKGFLDFSKAEPGFPQWQPFTMDWATRATQGPGTARTLPPDPTATSTSGAKNRSDPHRLLLRWEVLPLRRDLGRSLRPNRDLHTRSGRSVRGDEPHAVRPAGPGRARSNADPDVQSVRDTPAVPDARPLTIPRAHTQTDGHAKTRPEADLILQRASAASGCTAAAASGRRLVARGILPGAGAPRLLVAAQPRLTIVAPSPPSPRSPGRTPVTSGWLAASCRTASRSAPVPRPWITSTFDRPASEASSR